MHSTTIPFTLQLPADVPYAVSLSGLLEVLQGLVDQRKRRGVRYPLAPMLAIAVLAKLAGYSRLEALADWAKLRATELTQVFQLPRATMPHQTTWSRLFAHAVEITALETVVGSFLATQVATAEVPAPGSIVLVVDGKTLRGTIPLGQDHGTHLVAAYRPDHGLVLAQQAVDAKANEIVAVPQLLAQLDLTGLVVLGDAMQTQRALSVDIVEGGGDYLWFVKGNQPTLYDEIDLLFAPPVLVVGETPVPNDFVVAEQTEAGHGRIERRRLTVSGLLEDYSRWPYLRQVFKLERWSWDGLGRETAEVRYGVTSLAPTVADAARLLAVARSEWQIENGLHYRRDVTLQEDACQLRRGHAPHVMAALNNVVVGLVLRAGHRNLAAAQRHFSYAFDRVLARGYP